MRSTFLSEYKKTRATLILYRGMKAWLELARKIQTRNFLILKTGIML